MASKPLCWMCHGWGVLDKRPTGETSWSDGTGGEGGQRFPIYSLHTAFATYEGDLIECPYCGGATTGLNRAWQGEGEAGR